MHTENLVELAEERVKALKEAIRKLERRIVELEQAETEVYGPKLHKMFRTLQANQIPPEMHKDLVVTYFYSLLGKL
ncbi:MAG: hypothetical protein AAF702_33010 [Chloroflexota bacterium]